MDILIFDESVWSLLKILRLQELMVLQNWDY